jgi:hypothetical protein
MTNTLMNLRSLAFIFALVATVSCQKQTTEQENTVTAEPSETLTSEKRPAPTEFTISSAKLAKKRVWILEDGQSDIFHLKHDCPLLVAGKGKGTFKNIILVRAIEYFGRYNCQECSKELDYIFDENAVQLETKFGDRKFDTVFED